VGRAAHIARRKKKKREARKKKQEALAKANGQLDPDSCRIIHGDCLAELAKLQEGSVRLARCRAGLGPGPRPGGTKPGWGHFGRPGASHGRLCGPRTKAVQECHQTGVNAAFSNTSREMLRQ
jgi:hypothetical protein